MNLLGHFPRYKRTQHFAWSVTDTQRHWYQSDLIESEKLGHPPDDLLRDFGHPAEI